MRDSRGLLMRALSFPDDPPFKVRGWIENSFTGNANGRGNGVNFGVNPNYKADQWMGNQYYLIFERPLKQIGRGELRIPRRQPVWQRLAVHLHAGLLQSCVSQRLVRGLRHASVLRARFTCRS